MQNKSPTEQKKVDAEKAKLQMKKKTVEELAEMAERKTTSTESIDEPLPVSNRASETSLNQLNQELKKVPLVQAFNSAENNLEKPKK